MFSSRQQPVQQDSGTSFFALLGAMGMGAALMYFLDVENFPTLAIYRGSALLHYGVSLPQEGAVARLVDEIGASAEPMRDAPEPVAALPQAFR